MFWVYKNSLRDLLQTLYKHKERLHVDTLSKKKQKK